MLIKKILIANRGEIAVDIIKTCKLMNIKTVAIFSEADRNSLHVELADEKYCIGPSLAKKSYLNANNIISIALASGANAIHPGYGFLSEDYNFARLCQENDIIFIGPAWKTIKKLSNKISAKQLMRSLGMPVIEGYEVQNDINSLKSIAQQLGYPVMIKSKNGGGGRGMKMVRCDEELEKSVSEVLQESKQYFNNENLYMEKYIENASHIEVQIFADSHGNAVYLGTRDCSIQNENQKIIEEAPDTKMSISIRNKLCNMCSDISRKIGYTSCGTFEFLVDKNNNFYFMEINCRIQVERCVTEAVTGLDLITTQIKVAQGECLPWKQSDIFVNGHAIECRINLKKDTSNKNLKFQITDLVIPKIEGVTFKTAMKSNTYVAPFYDSMIGKLIVVDKNRNNAILKMRGALNELIINGIDTNIDLHKKILKNQEFLNCKHTTGFLKNLNPELPFCRMNVYQKLDFLIDKDTFEEYDKNLQTTNIMGFDHYEEKLKKAYTNSNNCEAVIYGKANIESFPCVIVVMDGNFMIGSMGVIVGEKITRAFELATKEQLPIIVVTVSGGARMQEGIFSLMQMIKTSAAVSKHSKSNLLYISVISNPTLGGVSASFATLADIIISEKNATFGFSGKRIVEEVIKKPLPDDFQSSDFNLKHGMIDLVLESDDIKDYLGKILKIHDSKRSTGYAV